MRHLAGALFALLVLVFYYYVAMLILPYLVMTFLVGIVGMVCLAIYIPFAARRQAAKRKEQEDLLEAEFQRKLKERQDYYDGLHHNRLIRIRKRIEDANEQDVAQNEPDNSFMFQFNPD